MQVTLKRLVGEEFRQTLVLKKDLDKEARGGVEEKDERNRGTGFCREILEKSCYLELEEWEGLLRP